jgi:hypothetical protein
MHQIPGRLFTPAIDSIAMTLRFSYPDGWCAAVAHRHSGDSWRECETELYERLTAGELSDVICATLIDLLAL